MKEIQLTQGKVALVDDDMYDYLMRWKWHLSSGRYAATNMKINGKFKCVYLHRFIMKASKNTQVDHIDNDKLNNLKSNLRLCNHSENMINRPAHNNSKSKFKGVVFYSLPPMTNNAGSFYSAGHAGAICVFTRNRRLKFAEGVLLTQNQGFDREPHARIVALHEMLHLLGANHIDAVKGKQYCNIMHPAAQACVNQVPILDLTKRQVRWCKQGKNVLGKKYV